MEVKQTDESTLHLEPTSKDESALVGMLFERITEIFPEWPMGDRSDHAMKMFAVVKKWAHDQSLTSESHRFVNIPQHVLDKATNEVSNYVN